MKLKLVMGMAMSVLSMPALAWNFTEHNVSGRYYEINNEYGATVVVSNVQCTKADGKDALTVQGYFSPTGKWNPINKRFVGSNVRQADQQVDDVFKSYVQFCADVNRS